MACACVVLLSIQLGVSTDSEELYTSMVHVLRTILADTTANTKGRSAVSRLPIILENWSKNDPTVAFFLLHQSINCLYYEVLHEDI